MSEQFTLWVREYRRQRSLWGKNRISTNRNEKKWLIFFSPDFASSNTNLH